MNKLLHVVTLLGLCFTQACSSNAVDLDADFRQDGNNLIIVNHNQFAYKQIEATVNENYHYKTDDLGAGQSLSIPLKEFSMADGTRYKPRGSKLMSMSLYAETPEGKPGKVELSRK